MTVISCDFTVAALWDDNKENKVSKKVSKILTEFDILRLVKHHQFVERFHLFPSLAKLLLSFYPCALLNEHITNLSIKIVSLFCYILLHHYFVIFET